MAFRLELSASFDYFNSLCRTFLDLWREHRACRPTFIDLEKSLR
jgi:hypothetical protein